jgi:hypothetical protein
MTDNTPPEGWYLDPTGYGISRYWNGVSWTQVVDRGGSVANAPIDPVQAQTPPGPGTQVTAPVPRQPPLPTTPSRSDHSVLGVILGVMTVFFLFLMVFAIVSDESNDDPPTINVVTPGTTVAPPEEPAPTTPASIEPTGTVGG